MSRVDIGFAEDCEPWQVESSLFPSKIGGKPAWLDPQNLPDTKQLECVSCKTPMVFLCQVYAPYEEDPNNFHRTLFVFICRNSKCCAINDSSNMAVFRSNLRRENIFYSNEAPTEEPHRLVNITQFASLCEVCGCLAPKRCSKCKKTAYCSREHQVIDWKENHKSNCGNNRHLIKSRILFDEYEMVVEPEEIDEFQVDEEQEIETFNKLKLEGKIGTLQEISESELETHASMPEDKFFMSFRKRISINKDQVLRYERGGLPLWIAKDPIPNSIPPCELCSSERQFEFQIMPQMLTILKETVIDWGILVVYSCKKSCGVNTGYKKEFIFKQDISDT